MAIRKSVVAVPARLQSSRLPNKVLADIGGKPMIQRVLERCREAAGVDAVVLCTDSRPLQDLADGLGFRVLMTSPDCSSGSERIASVADDLMALAWGDQLVHHVETLLLFPGNCLTRCLPEPADRSHRRLDCVTAAARRLERAARGRGVLDGARDA